MKKNITINLCGRLYQIDEDAYELLSHYTETLRNYFLKQEGGKEIADDIEERVAELLDDLKAQGIEAITIEHVEDIIRQIGQVEDIAGEALDNPENQNHAESSEKGKKPLGGKKFYRDSQNKMLSGVLSGCAQYFGGDVNLWRWGYAIACLLWWVINGVTPFTFGHLFALPLLLFVAPVAFFPVVPYLLAAIFLPETKSPEDVLKMKGKEVNPQTLTEEVQEHTAKKKEKGEGSQFWNIFLGVICIGLSTFLTIGFIVTLGFFVAFLAAHETMADNWWNIRYAEDIQAITFPVFLSGIMLLTSIGILLYCSIHAAVSSFGKTPSMSVRQRVMWFLLWVASTIGFIGCVTSAVGRLAKSQTERWNREGRRSDGAEVTITDDLGHEFNEEEYHFFKMNDWELITAENTDRYTYSGEWMTGNFNVRYLDACNDEAPVIYTARKTKEVEPGIYRLSAAVRASNANKFIYLYGQTIDPTTNDTVQLAKRVKEIPVFGTEGGNIVEYAKYGNTLQDNVTIGTDGKPFVYDEVINELVDRISPQDRQKISKAHHGKGFGWSYIYIDSIKVAKPSELFYGVTTDERITGNTATTGWFSATDFRLEKIGDVN